MRALVSVGVVLGLVAACGAADATVIAPGGSVIAAPITTTNSGLLGSFNNVAFTSQAPAGLTSTFGGTYSSYVYKDASNTLCGVTGNCLSFAIQVSNSARSRDGIETVTTGLFSNDFTYNVGYVAVNGGIAPLTISDSVFGAMAFNFTTPGNTAGLINPGQTSDFLVIQSSATNFTRGSISFQDSQTATVSGFAPAASVPEPASWAMMLVGFGVIGAATRRRRIAATFA